MLARIIMSPVNSLNKDIKTVQKNRQIVYKQITMDNQTLFFDNLSIIILIIYKMQAPIKNKIPSKQFMKIPLFRSVRQINGQKIYKSLYQTCRVISYDSKIVEKELSLKLNFIYVKQGEILIYKINSNASLQNTNPVKSLIKSYRAEQYCGFQDYPLFWGQNFLVQANANTTIVLVPLGYFYKFFRRVIPMTYLQSKAEYMKKLPLFRAMQLQKIFKLACLSQKFRVTKQSYLIQEGDKIDNIIIICSGKIQLTSSAIDKAIVCGQNQDFLVKEVRQDIPISLFTAKCLQEADILSIPVDQFKKVIDIRFKLKQTMLKQVTLNAQQTEKSIQEFSQVPNKGRYQTIYGRTINSRSKTEKNERSIKSATKKSVSRTDATQPSQQLFRETNYSLGEIQLIKFIRRKQKVETRNFFKYIESRAPEIVINPSKQFALFRPLYKSSSQYVRNMKRKIKHSINISQSDYSSENYTDFIL